MRFKGEFPELRNRRKFNPKMLSEWTIVRVPRGHMITGTRSSVVLEEHIWCAENTKARWSHFNSEESHWVTIPVNHLHDYNEFRRTFLFKLKRDAIRFRLFYGSESEMP